LRRAAAAAAEIADDPLIPLVVRGSDAAGFQGGIGMRRALFVALVAALLFPTVVTAANSKSQDFVTGSGKITWLGSLQVIVSAHADPNDQNAQGHFSANLGNGIIDVWADVTCLSVNGTFAGVAGTVRKDKGYIPLPPGSTVLISVIDNGPANNALPPDDVYFTPFWNSTSFCPFSGKSPIDHGNYVVNDAP
jgi:hypothetical protein